MTATHYLIYVVLFKVKTVGPTKINPIIIINAATPMNTPLDDDDQCAVMKVEFLPYNS
jgi:hypothetical protein